MNSSILDKSELYNTVFLLSLFIIFYNIIGGIFAINSGSQELNRSLFEWGMISFVQIISALGIANMICKMSSNDSVKVNDLEKKALKITGMGFYIIAGVLIIQSTYNLIYFKVPQISFLNILIPSISIIVMWGLIQWKTVLGNKLKSEAIIADVGYTYICLYISFVFLLSNVLYYYFSIRFIDSFGAYGIAFLAFKEGKSVSRKVNQSNHHSNNQAEKK